MPVTLALMFSELNPKPNPDPRQENCFQQRSIVFGKFASENDNSRRGKVEKTEYSKSVEWTQLRLLLFLFYDTVKITTVFKI